MNINAQTNQDINGLFTSSKLIKEKLNIEESKSNQIKENNYNKENKENLPINSPLSDKKFQNIMPSYLPINTLSDMSNNFNLNSNNFLICSNDMKNTKINNDEILENGLNLDEQKMNNLFEKIENNINLLKKEENNEENKKKYFNDEIKYINNDTNNNINNNINVKPMTNFNNNHLSEELLNYSEKNLSNTTKPIKESLPFEIKIEKELFDKIQYAIDERGNPFDIKQQYQTKNSKINEVIIKKPIALIIEQENKANNYLIDLEGNKIPKMEDGYFKYKHKNIIIIIKDFDVQHPELRIYGIRNREALSLNIKEKEETNNNINKKTVILNKKVMNLKQNSPIKIKNINKVERIDLGMRTKYRRLEYNLNNNKKQISSKRFTPTNKYYGMNYNPSSINLSNNYTINRTNKILNKSWSGIINQNKSQTISNESINKIKSKNNFNKIDNNKYDYNSITERNKLKSVTPTREVKNISCISSRINLFNYKRNVKRGKSFGSLSKILNLKNTIYRNSNTLKSCSSSNFDSQNLNHDYIILNNNNNNKSINSQSISSSNLKQSKSSQNISTTISNISHNIKNLKQKINSNNKTFTIPISKNNSELNVSNYNTNNSLYKRQFKCAILSKEVYDIISDYSNEKLNNKKISKDNLYNIYINDVNCKKNNEMKINSFLDGNNYKNNSYGNLSINNNIMLKRKNYITEPNYLIKNCMNNRNNIKNNMNHCELCGISLLNRMNNKNNVLKNGIINFKRKKMCSNNNINNAYSFPEISENYINNYKFVNNGKGLTLKNKLNLMNSRNNLDLEENKSQSNINNLDNEIYANRFNYNFSISRFNNSRNFHF